MNEHNDVNMASSTVGNSTTTACYGYCQYRLPCGYCKEMKAPCFYGGFEINKITCMTSGSINADGRGTIEVNYKDNNAVNVINKADSVII